MGQAGISPDSGRSLADANAASAAISLETQRADCRVIVQVLAVSVGVAQTRIDGIPAKGAGCPHPAPSASQTCRPRRYASAPT